VFGILTVGVRPAWPPEVEAESKWVGEGTAEYLEALTAGGLTRTLTPTKA